MIFETLRGKVANKSKVLTHARFALYYENILALPRYITEKIFDCFFLACVLVYWGANIITNFIPINCFIDRRHYSDVVAFYTFIRTITDQKFSDYQQRIAAFLESNADYLFTSEFFAETIVDMIVQDLGA